MRPILITLLTALYFVPVHAAEQMEASKDMVVLTISGDIHNINRLRFQRSFAFDCPMLLCLKQGKVWAQPRNLTTRNLRGSSAKGGARRRGRAKGPR